MFILISSFILFAAALTLATLRLMQFNTRTMWLASVGGAALALISVVIWMAQSPFEIALPAWQPRDLFPFPILFRADNHSILLALSVATLTLSILLTAVVRTTFSNAYTWVGILSLGGLGILAVTANNPLTLLLIWGALDITELVIQLRFVNGVENNEKVVISFSTRAMGIGLLLWSSIISTSSQTTSFDSITSSAGLYLVLAAGLRLGVLPLHLPYSAESSMRRGFGTSLRLISAASSLALLAHIPTTSLVSGIIPVILILSVIAAIYGGWMWLRAPDELNGRPYWIIGMASLAVISTLGKNPTGAAAWSCALILVGGSLFLSSVQNIWLNRALLIGAWSLSALPFSLTSGVWVGEWGYLMFPAMIAQALLVAGFIRLALRSSGYDLLDEQQTWTRTMYLSGIITLLAAQVLLGIIGWNRTLTIGEWLPALFVAMLTAGLVWAAPRLRILNPIRAHWVKSTTSGLNGIYRALWTFYQFLESVSRAVVSALEGESGVMWTLLFLILFLSLITQAR